MLLRSLSLAQATAFRDGVALTRFWVTGGVVKEEGTTPSPFSRKISQSTAKLERPLRP